MRYFDYPENKAAWEKELAALKKEKERRAAGIMSEPENELTDEMVEQKIAERSASRSEKSRESVSDLADESSFDVSEVESKADGYRVRMTYAELLMEEKVAIEKKNMAPSRSKEIQKEVAREL